MTYRAFDHKQNPLKSTSCIHVSKSTANKWVENGTHRLICRGVIQEISPEEKRTRIIEAKRVSEEIQRLKIPRACEPLAPRELPNTRFVEPQSVSWRLQHRTVILPCGT